MVAGYLGSLGILSYRQNWLRPFFAPLSGRGFSAFLARDFWPSENLWSPTTAVNRRWLKLLFVYSASAVAQLFVPLLATTIFIDFFIKDVPLQWWLIGVRGGTLIGLAFAVALASLTYASIEKKREVPDA